MHAKEEKATITPGATLSAVATPNDFSKNKRMDSEMRKIAKSKIGKRPFNWKCIAKLQTTTSSDTEKSAV